MDMWRLDAGEFEMVESRRALTAAAVAMLVLMSWVPAPARADAFDPADIVFPVIGEVHFTDTFYDARSGGRTHGATDIMGEKMQPVLAAADGVVRWTGKTCCYLSLSHGGGWETWYIHLNNDTPGTDDGQGWGYAPGIEPGAVVRQGQLIGWVGDSGNAEWTAPHLHFEIRKDGSQINPYPYLLDAPRLLQPVADTWSGFFADDDGSVHEPAIETLYEAGITNGCSTDPPEYCPEEQITRAQIAAFIARTFGLAASDTDFYADDDGTPFEDDINAVTAAGIGFGCDEGAYCPDRPLLREEMAELLVRAFSVPESGEDWFWDDDGSSFESSIQALKEAGITKGCDASDPGRFCPDRPLTRGEMATFFVRAMGA